MLRVQFCRLGRMVCGVMAVTRGSVRMMRGMQVITGFVMLGSLAVVPSSMIVVLCGLAMVFCGLTGHTSSLWTFLLGGRGEEG